MSVAAVIVTVVLVVLVAVIFITVFNAYYRKAGRGIVLIRTGLGGQRVVVDGGCLTLPFLHSTERVPTNSISLTVKCQGSQSLITADYIPIDLTIEFVLRVDSSEAGIQRASRVVGATNLNSDDLAILYQGRFVDAIQAEVSRQTLADLHLNRDSLGSRIKARLEDSFNSLGLFLESAALVYLDQSPLASLSDQNILHVQGMRTIAEQVSENRKQRAQIEADAEAAIKATELTQTRVRVEYERKQKEAEINLAETVKQIQAESEARASAIAEQAAFTSEEAKLSKEKSLREAEINRDLALRQQEINSLKELETAKIQSQIEIAQKRMDEIKTEAAMEESRVLAVQAQEHLQSERENLAAERRKEQAIIRANENSEVSQIEARTQARNLLHMTEAQAKATRVEMEAANLRMMTEAEGTRAMIAAENGMAEKLVNMKLEQEKISVLPEIAQVLGKPLEKIEGIRINHIGGPGWQNNLSHSHASPFSEVIESLLAMSLHLPALKKIGEEIGLDVDPDLGSRAAGAISRSRAVTKRSPESSNKQPEKYHENTTGHEGDGGK